MREAYIAAYGQLRRQLQVLADAIAYRAGIALCAKTGMKRAKVENVIGTAVAETHSKVELVVVSHRGKELYTRIRIYVYESQMAAVTVAGHIDNAYLIAFRITVGNVYESKLETSERVGIVVRTELEAVLNAGIDVQHAYLYAAVHSSCHICQADNLYASQRLY